MKICKKKKNLKSLKKAEMLSIAAMKVWGANVEEDQTWDTSLSRYITIEEKLKH